MIIKSLSRKGPSFGQLIGYIDQGAKPRDPIFAKNIYASHQPKWTAQQFMENHRWLPVRKNGNSLYHEIIAFKPQPGLSQERVRSILLSLAERYVSLRGPKQLTYGRIHTDTDHPHIHLITSSNELFRRKRVRHSQEEYHQIRVAVERYGKAQFPELKLPDIYDRPKVKAKDTKETQKAQQKQQTQPQPQPALKISEAEAQMIRRTGEPSTRQKIAQVLKEEVGTRTTWAKVQALAKRMGWELYQRGKTWGLIAEGRKYRFSTLGVEVEIDPRLQELQNFANARLHQFEEKEHGRGGHDWNGGRSR